MSTTTIINTCQDVNQAWLRAEPGESILLTPGMHKRWLLTPSGRPFQSDPVLIAALDPKDRPLVAEDRSVGSTDTARLRQGVRDLIVRGIDFQADDRSAVKTEYDGTRRVSFINCAFRGSGSGPSDPLWRNDSLWGFHLYQDGGFSQIDCVIERVYKEHATYQHNAQGNHAFQGNSIRHCGRTRMQFVARKSESGTPMPVGKGDVLVRGEYVEDVCLERGGGGWAYSFMGGMPDSVITIENTIVALGCVPGLATPFQGQATGGLLVQSAGPSQPGAGDEAHDGETKALILSDFVSRVGEVYWPSGSARRSNIRVGAVGRFELHDGELVNGGNGIALEIQPSVGEFASSADGQATHSRVQV